MGRNTAHSYCPWLEDKEDHDAALPWRRRRPLGLVATSEEGHASEGNGNGSRKERSEGLASDESDRKRIYRILLAEDNPVNKQVAEAVLKKRGWEVVSVTDGAQAVQAWQEQEFDLVLMDIQMPVMDGIEAARRIRKQEGGNSEHVPIIALTAYAWKENRDQCMAAGMDGFIAKPFHFQDLYRACERAMNSDDQS